MIHTYYKNYSLKNTWYHFLMLIFLWVLLPVFASFFYYINWHFVEFLFGFSALVITSSLWIFFVIFKELRTHSRFVKLIKEDKEQWEEVWDTMPCMICEISLDGVILQANHTFWGELEGDVLGTSFFDHFPKGQRGKIESATFNALKGSSDEACICDLNIAGVESAWSFHVSPFLGNKYAPRLVVLGLDITRQSQAESSLFENYQIAQDNEQKLSESFYKSSEALLVSSDGKVVEINNAASELLGASSLVGKDLQGIFDESALSLFGSFYRNLTGSVSSYVVVSGVKKRITLTIFPTFLLGRQMACALLVEDSLTDDEGVGSLRELLDDLLCNVQTPLNSLSSLAKEFSKSGNDCWSDLAGQSVESLNNLIKDVSGFIRLSDKKVNVKLHTGSLSKTLHEVVLSHSFCAQGKGVEVVFDFDESIPEKLLFDKELLKCVVGHLIQRSVHFTSAGHVLLSVKNVLLHDGQVRVDIHIEDTGLENSDVRYSGVYVEGMSLCDEIVSKMGGRLLQVSSTSVLLQIDMAIVGQPELRKLDGSVDILKVVVVTQNESTGVMFEHMLSYHSIDCQVQGDISSAIGVVQKLKVGQKKCVLIIDQEVVGVDFDKVKKVAQGDGVFLVALSDMGRLSKSLCLDGAGYDAYLIQPTCADKVFDVFREFMERGLPPSPVSNIEAVSEEKVVGPHVLLAEDIKSNQKVAQMVLNGLGVEHVTIAWNGAEAVDLVKNHVFDLILMDVQMPRLDGFQATDEIRKLQTSGKIKKVPIVGMTPNASQEEKDSCLSCGMDDVLLKPLKAQEVKKKLNQFLTSE